MWNKYISVRITEKVCGITEFTVSLYDCTILISGQCIYTVE